MEVISKRRIKGGAWYKGFVPRPKGGDVLIKAGATVWDTIDFIPQMVAQTLADTRELATRLKGPSLGATCKQIWSFVVEHIRYQRDKKGKEQVRRPARTLFDQKGDCDCMSGLVSSILCNLGIAHSLRVCKYGGKPFFQHIYVIVPRRGGGYYTIDPVVDANDYEEPFTEKKDVKMDLHYLNGPAEFDLDLEFEEGLIEDEIFDFEEDEQDELGRRRRRRRRRPRNGNSPFKRKGVNKINKFNPAAILLRNGILAAAKMDIPRRKNKPSIWRRLKLAYLTAEQARARGFNMANWNHLRRVLKRLQQTFHDAGGKSENLQRAILTGKANQDREVPYRSGLGNLDEGRYSESASLREILGPALYEEEFLSPQISLEGHGEGLGEVATGAAIAAAMTVLTAIAAMVGKVGEIRTAIKSAKPGGVDTIPSKDVSVFDPSASLPGRTMMDLEPPDQADPPEQTRQSFEKQTGVNEEQEDDPKERKSFGEWFGSGGWKWFAGAAALGGLGFITYKTVIKPKPKPKKTKALAGPPRKSRRKKPKVKAKPTHRKRVASKRRSLAKRRSPSRFLGSPLLGIPTGLSGLSRRKPKRRKKPKTKSKKGPKKKNKRKLIGLQL